MERDSHGVDDLEKVGKSVRFLPGRTPPKITQTFLARFGAIRAATNDNANNAKERSNDAGQFSGKHSDGKVRGMLGPDSLDM